MTFRVILTPRAAADADEAAAYIKRFSPERAARWFDGLMQAVLSLDEMPHRCPQAPEAEILGSDIRQLLYGKRGGVYRIVFRIYGAESTGPVVRVLAVRHSARRPLQAEDVSGVELDDPPAH
jgi:plasmid stabilization system protein ParE